MNKINDIDNFYKKTLIIGDSHALFTIGVEKLYLLKDEIENKIYSNETFVVCNNNGYRAISFHQPSTIYMLSKTMNRHINDIENMFNSFFNDIDHVVYIFGTNDCIRIQDSKDIQNINIDLYLNQINEVSKRYDAKSIIMGPFLPKKDFQKTEVVRMIHNNVDNSLFSPYDKVKERIVFLNDNMENHISLHKNFTFINCKNFLVEDGKIPDKYLNSKDGIHLSEEAIKIYRELIYNAICDE